MTAPVHEDIERVVLMTVDCLRYDFSHPYRDVYPDGIWYKGTTNATWTPPSHASMLSGLNPPRHGVLNFGMPLEHDNLLTSTDSYCGSGIVNEETYGGWLVIPGVDDELVEPVASDDERTDANNITHQPEPERAADVVEEHDVSFFHDWMIHHADPNYGEENTAICPTSDMTEERLEQVLEHNIDVYEDHVEESAAKHEAWLDILRDRGLYENTLFMTWGDHGQSIGYPPMRQFGHGNSPTACTARIPISFTSPLFDGLKVDEETNPRGVDVWPTISSIMDASGIDNASPSHEVEGVDLTSFGGQLYGYCIREGIAHSGVGDAIADNRYIHLENDFRQLFEDTETPDGHTRSKPVDNDFIESVFDEKRREVRRNRTRLIKESEVDKEQLEDMGYYGSD